MIMLNLRGQTGNDMFQYAAGKTYADSKNYRFCFRKRFDARFKRKKTGQLYRYFELDGETPWQLAFWRGVYTLTPGKRTRLYRNQVKQYTPTKTDEIYDTRFYSIPDGSTMQGAFQSERYFSQNRASRIYITGQFKSQPGFQGGIEEVSSGYLFWPDIGVDIGIETIEHPERFPFN